MSFDGLVMSAVKSELKQYLTGGRVEKIYQPLTSEIVLIIHKDREKYRLLLSANASDARVHLTRNSKKNPVTPPMFCMVLRKHLEGGKILDVQQHGLERVLSISVESVDELGMLSVKHLVCEVMGKHSNIILVDPASNVILDGIHRYSYATSRHREVLPGRKYVFPPESGKIDPLTANEETFRKALWDPEQDIPVYKLLLNKFEGLGPQTCREIVYRTGISPDTSNQVLGEIELNALWQVFSKTMSLALSSRFEPVICFESNRPKAFSAIKLSHLKGVRCISDTISHVLDEYFSAKEKQDVLRQVSSELMKLVNREMKKCKKKIEIHQQNMQKAKDAEKYKIYGELITANIYQIPKYEEKISLVNFYDPEGKAVDIPLDPGLSPADNAQSYFKKYAKAKNSLEISKEQLNTANIELDYLESVLLAIEQAECENDLQEIKSELIKEGYIKPDIIKTKSRKIKKEHAEEPAPIKFNIGKFDILVGRNNKQNDYLTMKLANPGDLWLHVKNIPGSHVIIRNPQGQQIPEEVLQKAAETAAYYSKGRESSKVPVDYTLKKNVRKPKGAKPGMVIYDNYNTLIAEPKPLE